ncbi:hypothetical protein N7499_003536 [Penicillium canescens]|uniref:Uncharacterized protein n=1 Tax=Penicillium canescens TaxID=5083 RepID=A0AAD6IA24_PENCN|nr:uncharacterized protein N7446_012460 [Penicillium canescens]KAJ6038200.1 hypothetical protein N7460_007971 [Penicillium canescens]KAJ6045596.1 hypothetical protein N7446_012460 [Penicillium canescens]KAJ6090822.1 hypothetical protein N7499_003536 [Penicillium canescens]
MRHFSNWTIVSHRQVWSDLSDTDQLCCALLKDVQNQRTALGDYQGAAGGVIQVSGQYHHSIWSSDAEFSEAAVRGKRLREQRCRRFGRCSSLWRRGTAPCVRQPAETGRPVPCDPGIRYHFTAARSLGPAGRERKVADESEDVERRTELYTCVGGASWRWREAEPPVRGRRGPLDHLWTC